jgi:hypothetical protein
VQIRLERDIQDGVPLDKANRIATRLWPQDEPGEDLDFALLGLPLPSPAHTHPEPPPASDAAVPWSSLGDWGEIEVSAVGYPDLSVDHSLNRRDTKGIKGWIQLANDRRSLAERRGTLTIRLRDEDTPPEPAAIAWPAMSGAAVFFNSVLIGIIRIVGEERGRHQLHALPIDRLFDRNDVLAAIRAAGYAVPPRVDSALSPRLIDYLDDWSIDSESVYRRVQIERFVGKRWLTRRILDFLQNNKHGYLVIQGRAGTGKSAYLAYLARKFDGASASHFVETTPGRGGVVADLEILPRRSSTTSGFPKRHRGACCLILAQHPIIWNGYCTWLVCRRRLRA